MHKFYISAKNPSTIVFMLPA